MSKARPRKGRKDVKQVVGKARTRTDDAVDRVAKIAALAERAARRAENRDRRGGRVPIDEQGNEYVGDDALHDEAMPVLNLAGTGRHPWRTSEATRHARRRRPT